MPTPTFIVTAAVNTIDSVLGFQLEVLVHNLTDEQLEALRIAQRSYLQALSTITGVPVNLPPLV